MSLQLIGDRPVSLDDIQRLLGGVWHQRTISAAAACSAGIVAGDLAWVGDDRALTVLIGLMAGIICGACLTSQPNWSAIWFCCAFGIGQLIELNRVLDTDGSVESFVISLAAFNFVPLVAALGFFAGHHARQLAGQIYEDPPWQLHQQRHRSA